MDDQKITIEQLQKQVAEFVLERDWNQFHAPKNLAMNISAEANELMEKFLWCGTEESRSEVEKNRQEVEDEFADVFFALLAFANQANIDIIKAFEHKFALIKAKYPVEKAKGKSTKYDKL